ncbi:MAG TPA: ATP-binding protein [Mycobacteriales bacterium]|jgi:signal transduction histidine kinase/ActR/RegA family two-component response regulator|nr:ATP-binding protein [Mycobacteriales bacterium]
MHSVRTAEAGFVVKRKVGNPLRPVSWIVLIVFVGMTVAASLVVRAAVADEQRRLLRARTSEAGVLLSTAFQGITATLPVLGLTTQPQPGATAQFTSAARALLGDARAIGAAQVSQSAVVVVASVGNGPAAGSTLSTDRASLVRRAASNHGLTAGVLNTPDGRVLSFTVPTSTGMVLYEDLPLSDNGFASTNKDGPFSELEGALYASTRPDPATLVLTTTRHLPLTGTVDRQQISVGTDRWLLLASSPQPLVGSLSANAVWATLVAGLAGALLITVLVETLVRRRAYALALVEERTTELQQALDERAVFAAAESQARATAEAANRSKDEFLSRMSHELRTPLNAILGFGQLLSLDELNESQAESVDQILKGGRHLLDLINEVLDIARIETGTLPLSPEPVLVSEVVADSLTLMQPLAAHRRLRLNADRPSPAQLHVLADRQRLKQILLNLIGNAIKYNHDGGSVTVSFERGDDDQLRIHVTDTGPGIRPEQLPRLFVPFERLGAERSDVEGAGVGLALSRRLAEAMGGTLEVSSAHGEGSRFTTTLRIVDGPLDQYEKNVSPADGLEPGTPESPRHKVLYIEDNISNVRLVERIMERRPEVELIPAMQGSLGITLAREHQPALILLDLHLPDINGDAVLRQLREGPVTAHIPVIIVSADATPGQVRRLLDEGATAYLTKPFDVETLLQALDDALTPAGLAVDDTVRS